MNNNVEERLADEKKRIASINAPEDLEMRLRNALDAVPVKRKKKLSPIWKIAAVVLLITVISGNSYNAFAYYGKKIFGFDDVIQGTLQQLNEQGMGQSIDQKTTLADGTELTINGIMADANQFIVYYTLNNPKGLDETEDQFRPFKIDGFLTDSNVASGVSLINEEQTEIKGTMTFDSVSPFSKKLTLHYWEPLQNGQMSEGTITFPYNPNQAMVTQIKQKINKKIKVDKGSITFKSITATPTMTVIRGNLNVEYFDRIKLGLQGIELIANGSPVQILGSGSQSSFGGRTFDIRFDTLPKELHSLQLVFKEFVGYQKLEQKYSLAADRSSEPLMLGDKELWIKEVSKTSQGIEVTIATEDDVLLDGVSIETENESTPLTTTIHHKELKQTNGKLLKERTLLFETQSQPDNIRIQGIHYVKEYNKVIEIPVD